MQNGTFAQALLAPQAVALVGASGDPAKNTARPLRFMRKHGYTGHIYPINAARPEILGERAYPDLAALPGPVDHVFVMVPGPKVAEQLEGCARAGAKVVTIYSDGFGETGAQGRAAQEALVAQARALGLRLLGPNSIGLANVHSGAILSVNAVFESDDLPSGGLSLVSQSGSMMGSLLSRAGARGFGFAKSVSVGNESDISVGEIVHALACDDQTSAILLFLETLRDAPVLARALDAAQAAGKPVIAYKLGRSTQGEALAQSHTGAMAGNDVAVDAFLRAHGVLRVESLETLYEIVPLAQRYGRHAPRPQRAPQVAVITTTGGGAATVVDNLGLRGLVAATPPDDFVAHMAGRGLKLRQAPIIDLTLAASSAQYQDLLENLLTADWCDAVLSVAGSSAQFHPEFAVQPLVQARKSDDKPVVAFLAPEAMASLRVLQREGIAGFRTPESCAEALALFMNRPAAAPPPPGQGPAQEWPAGLPATGALTEYEAGQVFGLLGIPTAATRLVPATGLEHDLRYPVALKISSRDIAHKTDAGGVRIGIRDQADLRRQAADMLAEVSRKAPKAALDGILIQQMEDKLLELILGYRLDPLVGPIVLLGAGGIAAELTPDVSVRLAPVDRTQAMQMIEEVRATRLIRGFRGLPEGDCQALADAIVAFSRLALLSGARVAEAEINPLFVQRDGVVAVDGLLHLQAADGVTS
ncbi:acetate--CoA ligase family protein [Bordetella petrii]|uniref:acetate--CoA ligase family protein n=1 Tax=Bordetella petrii TaxID=94624 RepID=UPI001E2D6F2A|nr:acetate--CoA ligase family protein [Bordetella petrii]MCD0505141.1 acetate--CoA ligase family protein [Bordetella petrii]